MEKDLCMGVVLNCSSLPCFPLFAVLPSLHLVTFSMPFFITCTNRLHPLNYIQHMPCSQVLLSQSSWRCTYNQWENALVCLCACLASHLLSIIQVYLLFKGLCSCNFLSLDYYTPGRGKIVPCNILHSW